MTLTFAISKAVMFILLNIVTLTKFYLKSIKTIKKISSHLKLPKRSKFHNNLCKDNKFKFFKPKTQMRDLITLGILVEWPENSASDYCG